MSAWYSNILTTTTSRISTLRSTLLGGDADGDTEDDTHVCRVLRAYYTEKGRSFPQWLPPDPKAPPPPVATPVNPTIGSRYGGGNMNAAGGGGPQGGSTGALSSLWDNKTSSPVSNANSLRNSRGGGAASAIPARRSPFANNRNSDIPADNSLPVQARPLPSQRLGSYQSTQSAPAPTNSAQDKLRNLFGSGAAGAGGSATNSRSNSPALNSSNSSSPYARANPYSSPPPQASSTGRGSDRKPFMAANAPWATDEYEYSQYGGGGGGGGSSSGGRQGLPRRPGGLPNGPRHR